MPHFQSDSLRGGRKEGAAEKGPPKLQRHELWR